MRATQEPACTRNREVCCVCVHCRSCVQELAGKFARGKMAPCNYQLQVRGAVRLAAAAGLSGGIPCVHHASLCS
jgi:hypothetical protein